MDKRFKQVSARWKTDGREKLTYEEEEGMF